MDEQIKEALLKRAVGGETSETLDEYACKGKETVLKLVKRKVSTKCNLPDVAALKVLLALSGRELENMSDVELLEERERLINELKTEN